MPYATEFVEGGNGLIFKGSGILTEHELVEVRLALKSNPEVMQNLAYALIDLENVVELRSDRQGVRRIAAIDELLAKLTTNMIVGIVAPKDHIFGIAQMWESNAIDTGWPIRVVRSHSEASAWFAKMLALGHANQSGTSLKLERPHRDPRIPFVATVVISDIESERQISTRTGDLSVSGCFVSTPTPFKKGDSIRITIVNANTKVVAFGRVIYANTKGMGVAFTAIEARDRAILDRWMSDLRVN